MQIKKTSLSDLFEYLIGSFRLVRKNLSSFALASLLSYIVIIMIDVLFDVAGFVPVSFLLGLIVLYIIAILVGLLLLPPLIAGWINLCQNLALGKNTSATEIFRPYTDVVLWKKISIYSIFGILLYIACSVFIMIFLHYFGFEDDLQRLSMAQMSGNLDAVSDLSASFYLMYLGLILLSTFLHIIYLLGLSQATLTTSTALDSLKYAIASVLKNILSFIVFIPIIFIVSMFTLVLIGFAMSIFAKLTGLIHLSLAAISIKVFLTIILFSICSLVLSFVYLLWKSILSNGNSDSLPISTKDSEFLM